MRTRTTVGIGLLALLIAACYLWTLLRASDGRPVAPLDDAYIHFQYARQIARGHPWQYNDDAPLSTGATSPLYPFLLAAGYMLRFSGERLVWFAMGLGIASLAISTWLVYRITGRLVKLSLEDGTVLAYWAPAGASVLFLLSGAVQWTFFSGMESGLFTIMVLAALDAFLAKSHLGTPRPYYYASLWIALAALTRPGGVILSGVLWLVVVGHNWQAHRSKQWKARARSALKNMWPVSLAVLIGLSPFLLNQVLTGSPIATGAQAKSWLGNIPFRFWDILRSIFANYRRIIERFTLGLLATRPWFLAPGMLLLASAGWGALLRRRQWGAAFLGASWFFLGTLATAALITATWHVGRYQVPFLAVLTPLAALGVVALVNRLPDRWRTPAAACVALGLLATTLVSTFQARSLYQRAVHTVTQQHLAIADWIRDNLPRDARVGVHDTGAIRYVGQRPTYDMIGLTSQGAAIPWRHGAGAVFERMERSPMRPNYFATYPDVFSMPYLAATDLFDAELLRVDVPDFAVASAGPVQAIYQADWHLAGSGDDPYQADMLRRSDSLKLVDAVDLADLKDEAEHDLIFWEEAARPGFPTEVQQYRYRADPTIEVIDGGRLVNGGLAFQVTCQAGQPLLLISRLHAVQAGAVRVVVDGQDVGRWRYPALPGQWLETAFEVPAAAVTQDTAEIRLEVDTSDPAFRHFAIYYLWVWQGTPAPFVPRPEQPLSAQLGDAIELIGYDLASTSSGRPGLGPYQPGDSVELVLYWHAAAKPTVDAKVFVHLYDQNGEIVTQQDRRPYYGTRPPYTWSLDEALDDPYTLELPPDLLPGRYTLAAGMYHSKTAARLPVVVSPENQLPDDRILLNTVTVAAETD